MNLAELQIPHAACATLPPTMAMTGVPLGYIGMGDHAPYKGASPITMATLRVTPWNSALRCIWTLRTLILRKSSQWTKNTIS